MASALHTKTTSYTHERGIEMSEAFSVTPTRTGTLTNGTYTVANASYPPVFKYDGPAGGAGCWEFAVSTNAAQNTHFRTFATSERNTALNDADWVFSFWIKFTGLPTSSASQSAIIFTSAADSCGFTLYLAGANNTDNSFTGSKLMVQTGVTTVTQNFSNTQIFANKWYMVSIKRAGSGSNNYSLLINGAVDKTWTNSETANSSSINFGSSSSAVQGGTPIAFRMSNYLLGSTSVFTNSVLAEIYTVGKTGYEKGLEDLNITPYSWYQFDNTSGIDLVYDSGSSNQTLNLSSNPTWLAYPNGASKGAISLSAYGGYDTACSATYGQNNTIAFWFKRTSAPTSQLQWSYKYYNSDLRWDQASQAGINTNGTITFAPFLGSQMPALTSTTNICDGQWHYVVITRAAGTDARMYIDGSLQSSQTWSSSTIVSSSIQPFAGQGNSFDDYIYWDTTALSAGQISALYASTISSTNAGYTAQVMLVTQATMTDATVTAQSSVSVTYNSEAFGGNFNTATMVGAMTSTGVNLNAPGVSTASADFVLPITSVSTNLTYSHTVSTATATMIHPITTTTNAVEVYAVPATASALISSNFYGGNTAQDSTYDLTLRKLETDTGSNASANSGFSIGRYKTGGSGTFNTRQLLIIPTSGIPVINKIVKVKFDSAHVSASSTNDISPNNRFNVYKVTSTIANPTTTTASAINKTLLYTTRLLDDSTNGTSNFYLDLTPAFADATAYTNGIVIESFEDGQSYSGWDETVFSGSNLNNHLLYILSADIISRNVNANAMTADSTSVMPVVVADKYLDYSASPATANVNIVHPAVEATKSNTTSATAVTASGLMVQPAFARTVQYTPDHLEADARTVMPVITIINNVAYSASIMTASSLMHMPQFSVGENNSADHMNASATFPTPLVVLSPTVVAMVATVSGAMVNPTIGAQLLGSVSAQAMTAQAFLPVPSNYDPVTLDKWFNRLYTQDAVTPDKYGSILFMKPAQLSTAGTLGVGSIITSVGLNNAGTATAISAANAITSPTPAATQGTYDGWNRKALAFKNISFRNRNPIGGSDTANRSVDRGYTLETMIKTTKANQILFIGQNGYTFEANPIGLKDGKLFIKTSVAASLDVTDARLLNATTLMQATETNIADGQWHHILIQFGYDGRHQFWVDGELELQRYGYKTNYVNLIGYNSANSTLSSEFEMSAFSVQAESFLSERDVQLNYFAAINFTPIQVEPMTASLGMTQDNTAKGNRGRALMLYFWSTRGLGNNSYYRGAQGGIDISLQRNTSFDQGSDYFDYDTSANLSTWELENNAPQQWQGWDIFPIDVQGIYASSVVKPESYKNLFTSTYFSGQNDISWKQAEGFYDEQTDNRRYIDLIKDIDNLEDFDMIFFRNYPDQGSELDSFSKFESVDSYFQLQEKTLFEDFLKSLRGAIDTGISLMVTNPQLAIDLGIIDRVEVVSQLKDQVGNASDAHAKATIEATTGGGYKTNDEPGNENTQFFYADTYTNNRHRLITEVDGLTTTPAYIWKETVYYNNDGAIDFGGNDRWWNKYDYKPNGIPAGDDFIIATYSTQKGNSFYQAVPFANIKAGKALTAFSTTYNRNGVDVDNPYKNYATSIILEPGDTLNGRQIGGKIFVSFTETLQGVGDYDVPREYAQIDLVTDERINFAYNQGAITLAQKTAYLADTAKNLDRRRENNLITQEQYEALTYWEDNGNYITSALQYGNTQEVVAEGNPSATGERSAPLNKYALKPNQSTVSNFTSSGPWFTISWGYTTPRVNIWVPSINVRAFSWLYNREFLEGKVQSHTAQNVYASMPHPTISADKQNSVNAQAMLSNATITQGAYSNSRSIAALPFEAIATMTQHVRNVKALPMTASVALRTTIGVLTSSVDEVVLYVHHEDPVLYLREEVIK
jgi:hypothetical protein